MADHVIVSCPGCGKRYSVPPGVPPGQFQCQDCSAVVAYGQGGAVAPPPKGGGGGRTKARAAAAKRRSQGRRRDEDDEDEADDRGRRGGASKETKSPLPYIMGFGIMAVFAGVVAYLATRDDGKPAAAPTVATGTKSVDPSSLGLAGRAGPAPEAPAASAAPAPVYVPPPPPPAPPPAPEPARPGIQTVARSAGVEQKSDPYKEVANPPSGGNYGKTQNQLLMMIKDDRGSVLTPLDHLPDTPPDVAQKIDDHMAKILDVNSGSAALRAKDALVKIGRPAIPKVLSAFSKFDFSRFGDATGARDECGIVVLADEILHEITAYPKAARLQYTPEAKLSNFQAAGEDWYVWWLTIGYKRATFYKKAADEEDKL